MAVDLTQVAHVDAQPGELPPTMAAWVIRQEREGEPVDAFQVEEIEVPEPGAFEVIVRVMAAGVNFNNVWAALDRKSTRLNSSHMSISYAVFCLKKKKKKENYTRCKKT